MGVFALRKEIEAQLKKGKSRLDVFQSLVKRDENKAGKFAYAIATIPKTPIPEKCMMANTLLLIFLVCSSVLSIISALPIDMSSPTIFIVIQFVVPLICLYFCFHYHGAIYRVAVLWFLVDFIEALLQFKQDSIIESIRILVLFFIIVLSMYMARKLFPNLRLLGPKKDAGGHFLL